MNDSTAAARLPRRGCAAALEQWHSRLEEIYGAPQQETDDPQLRAKLIIEEAIEADEAVRAHDLWGKPDRAAIGKELADVLYVVYGTARFFDLPLDAIFAAVHESNMTKLIESFPRPENGKVPRGDHYVPPLERIAELIELWDSLGGAHATTDS
jgi:NTP pyrophosphatase (non-canonical NTP hydrolase)